MLFVCMILIRDNLIKNEISPESLKRLPTNVLINVDLPEPFLPIKPITSPG